MKPKEIRVLTLNDDPSKARMDSFMEKLPDDVFGEIPLRPYFGLDGRIEEVPDGWTAGRWHTDLSNLKGSKAVCYSHMSLILGALGSCPEEDDCILVLEDDVQVHADLFKYLDEIDLPEDWDFLHLSYWDDNCGGDNQQRHSDNVNKIIKPCCTGLFSYFVKPRKVFRRLINSLPMECEVDNFLTNEISLEKFNIYVIEHNPWLTNHVSDFSLRNSFDDITWKIGDAHKVVSFCLYGEEPIYNEGVIENIKLCKTIYPNWEVRVYCSPEAFGRMSSRISEEGGTPIEVPPEKCHPVYGRMLAIEENKGGITIFRDADSRVSQREADSVKEWLVSGKTLHLIADHGQHFSPIMAGMFGLFDHDLPEIDWPKDYPHYGDDEKFLTLNVLNPLGDKCFRHGLYGGIPLPELAEGEPHIGEKIYL